MTPRFMGAVCVIVVCVILSLGLWPFHRPRNDVAWMNQAAGLAFGRYGTVLSSGPLRAARFWTEPGGSIEVWVQPDCWNSATILALYRPEQKLLVALRQSLADLEVVAETRDDSGEGTTRHFYVDNALATALRQKKPVFISVTAGPQGTMVYLDGALTKVVRNFRSPYDAFGSRLILGDSPRQPDSFRGQIRGLAIYQTELNGGQILHHYRNWVQKGRPDLDPDQHNVALYLFNEQTGDVVHNQVGETGDLCIPDSYLVLDKIFLEPFWKEFNFSESYWSGNLKNIIGFVPLGFCFYAYFAVAGPRRQAIPLTFVWGALLSLTIEVLQAVLPTRDSGTTDLITNIIGTWMGMLAYKHIYLLLVNQFRRLGWFAPKSSHGTVV
jgi:VanZ like family/Concanavalin A-like lectin/glucanases superfamily